MQYLTATIRKKLMFAFTAMALLIASMGVTGVWFTSAVGKQGEHLGARLGPLVEAAMLVQLRSTEARLKFEEISTQRERDLRLEAEGENAVNTNGSVDTGASDVEVGLIEVWALLDETLLYVDAVLYGGETPEGKFEATTSPIVREKMEQIRDEINDLKSTGREKYVENASIDEAAVDKFQTAFDDFLWLADEAEDAMKGELVAGLDATRTYTKTSNYLMGAISIIGIALGTLLGWGFGRSIASPLAQMTGVTGKLAGGDMEVEIPGGDRKDEIGEMARSLEQIRAVGVRAAQAQSSLDGASSPMMIVDPQGTVIFPNKAMNALFDILSEDLSDHLSGYSNGAVTGVEFDLLHNVETIRSEAILNADNNLSARMVAGGRTIDLTASPVFNDQGDRLGAVVEWLDMTGQVAVEREIAGIVHSATEGDFSQRLREADKDGFMADLARGMNELLDVVDNGLTQVVKVMSALAEGDMTRRMQGAHKGAFARLKDDADRMGDRMEEIVGRISEVSGAVQTATDEISSGITDLSARTEHQASSLEETTASMEELSATVRQNADNAQEANQVATAAREVATSGGDIVGRSVKAMSGIEASSRKITEIVGLIQEIAFQTNLLALNASVEAARAGEAGRGFAVVANEVRALAQRAAAASKDIKELIVNSDNQVQEGVKLVGEAGASLEQIVSSVKKVADYVSEIASASQEQTSGIEQVSAAITGMDEMTQQNASLVEETTGAIQSASGQVIELQQTVGFFRTTQNRQPDKRPADKVDNSGQGLDEPLRDIARKMAEQAKPVNEKRNPPANVSTSKRAAAAAIAVPVDGDWEEF